MSQTNHSEFLRGGAVILILTLLNRKEMHGYDLLRSIESESAGAFAYKEGTLYPLLHQLEKDGSIVARWEDTESSRKRKFYKISPQGRKLLKEKKEQWISFRNIIDQMIKA
jgi:DNA-binding PadR family transcriptional regulator